MEIQQRILQYIIRLNWILFGIVSILGILLTPSDFARGVVFGGLLVTINFHLLYRTLKKAFKPTYISSFNVILAKYYSRLILSGIIIFVLISRHYVNPLGLMIGLSVVVVSIIMATFRELKYLLFSKKEDKKDKDIFFSELAYYGSLGFSLAIFTFAGLAIGIYLDRKVFNTSPWLTVIFLVIGIILGFGCIGRAIKRIRKY